MCIASRRRRHSSKAQRRIFTTENTEIHRGRQGNGNGAEQNGRMGKRGQSRAPFSVWLCALCGSISSGGRRSYQRPRVPNRSRTGVEPGQLFRRRKRAASAPAHPFPARPQEYGTLRSVWGTLRSVWESSKRAWDTFRSMWETSKRAWGTLRSVWGGSQTPSRELRSMWEPLGRRPVGNSPLYVGDFQTRVGKSPTRVCGSLLCVCGLLVGVC